MTAATGAAPARLPERLTEIDGIRGWAACIVLVQHFVWPFAKLFPVLDHPAFLLMNGTLAVQIFFVLSGDALSSAFFRTGDRQQIDRLLLKRYPRLTMPIVCSCLAVYGLNLLGLNFLQSAGPMIQHPDTVGATPGYSLDLVLLYSFVQVYLLPPESPLVYHPFLWTMNVEFKGSLAVFLLLYLFPRLRHAEMLTGILAALAFCFVPDFAGFFIGMLFGHWRQTGRFACLHSAKLLQFGSLLALLWLALLTEYLPKSLLQLQVLLAVLFIGLVYCNRWLLAFFRNRLSRWLGDLSFPIYVMHFAVLISLTSGLIVWFAGHGGLNGGNVSLIILTSFIATFAVAWLLRRLEIPYLRALGHLVDFILKDKAENNQRTQADR